MILSKAGPLPAANPADGDPIRAVIRATGVNTTLLAQQKTQWDGVYTEDQAKRGQPLYSEKCSSCHGPDMNGGEMAPSLSGGEFQANWNDLTLGDLFERMRISMPQNNPGSLSRQQNADILAAILQNAQLIGPSSRNPPGSMRGAVTSVAPDTATRCCGVRRGREPGPARETPAGGTCPARRHGSPHRSAW